MAELLDGLGVKLPFIGAVLLGPALLIRAVSDDQPAGHGEPSEGLHQCGPDIILRLEFVRGGEPVRGMSDEQRRGNREHEHEHADEGCPGQCPEPWLRYPF